MDSRLLRLFDDLGISMLKLLTKTEGRILSYHIMHYLVNPLLIKKFVEYHNSVLTGIVDCKALKEMRHRAPRTFKQKKWSQRRLKEYYIDDEKLRAEIVKWTEGFT